jgi:D-alanyl-D-alanine carboxypeptidase/D-alanyl-D-alanine-endopeptidase (penicillin-binding protein 4)
MALMMSAIGAPVRGDDNLEARILDLFQAARLGERARLAVLVADPHTGDTILAINADVPMKPASTTKLFTAAAMLHHYHPTHRFETVLETDGALAADGVVEGDLIVRGGGDAALGPRFQDGGEVDDVLRKWATELKRLGVRAIQGDIVGDDSFFADDRWGPGWYVNERGEYYMAEVAALSFNDNCIDVTFRAEGEVGTMAAIEKIAPQTTYWNIASELEIVPAGTSTATPDFVRDETARLATARGKLAQGASRTRWAAVPDPAHYTAWVFREVLVAEGIAVSGGARSRHRAEGSSTPNPPARYLLYRHLSHPVADLIVPVLNNSQNLHAETLGRHVALAAGHPPTFAGACAGITEHVQRLGLPTEGFVLRDASGLSPHNRASARTMGALLQNVDGQGYIGYLFKDALDRAGERGTMRSRLPELRGRLRGKTGALGDTSTLAGFLTSKSGTERIAVVMIDGASGAAATVNRIFLALDEGLE